MIEERLHKIIETIEQQKHPYPETGSPASEADSVNISLVELTTLAGILTDIFPEEVKSFADSLSGSLNEFNAPELSIPQKADMETSIAELFERNKNSIGYLNSLNRVLISADYDRSHLVEHTLSYNLSSYKDHPLPDFYLERLAESYVHGNNSTSIWYLLKTKNPVFLESIDFIKTVKTAIVLSEREQLKKKMQLLDGLREFDLPESAVKAAIILSERERLKEVMRKLDTEEGNKVTHLPAGHPSPVSKDRNRPATIISFEKSSFNWKKYAVAASVIGLIAISAVLLYNNKKTSSDIARNKPAISDSGKNKLNTDQGKNDVLAANQPDSADIELPVKKEAAMGFAAKQEKITTRIYRLKEKILGSQESQKQPDSLTKLNKTYILKDNTLFVYLTTKDLPELYKIENKYYLKLTDTLYQLRPSIRPAMLTKVTDNSILDRIVKISYQQSNQ